MTTPPGADARSSWRANLLLFGVTCALCLGVIEAVGEWRRPLPPPRALFFSENPWRWDERGFLAFAPSRTIRTAAAYGDVIDYDVTFRTNAQGFIDDRDYGPGGGGERRIAVVGDSFTAGYHGGRAWVPTLRDGSGFDPQRHSLFNFGVSGTGMPNFRGVLDAYTAALAIDEILVVAIANDFERPMVRSLTTPQGIALCQAEWTDERCRAQRSQMFTFPISASHEELLERAAGLWSERRGSLLRRIRDHSFLLHGVRRLIAGPAPERGPGFAALAAIRARFPEVRLAVLQVPEKRDALDGTFESLRAEVEASGARYYDGAARCGLTGDDFLPLDSHPAASGYAKLRACVLGVLGL